MCNFSLVGHTPPAHFCLVLGGISGGSISEPGLCYSAGIIIAQSVPEGLRYETKNIKYIWYI